MNTTEVAKMVSCMQSVDVEKKAETHRRMFFRSAYTNMISVLNMKVLLVFALLVLGFMIFMIYTLFHVGNLHPNVGPSVTEEEKETVRPFHLIY